MLLLVVLLGPDQRVLRLADLGQARARRELTLVVVEVVENLADELALIGVVDDREVRARCRSCVPSRRSMRTHMEWNVPTHRSRAGAPTMRSRRDFISPAALFVNVTARMRSGATLQLLEQVGDAVREHPRLAAAGAGENQNRAIGMLERPQLARR